jgi:tetratricopeptide (TPR) repeat protein
MQDPAVPDNTWNVASQKSAMRRAKERGAILTLVLLVAASSPCLTLAADKKCQIGRVAELPITMNSLRPMIPTKINGQDAQFTLDSGAFYSMISSASAAEYKLKTYPGPFGLRVTGVNGSTDVQLTKVKEFTIVGANLKNVEFLVGGSEVGLGAVGVLGQNLLETFDVEYDLANGVIRLFKTENCGKTNMAYWRTPQQSYSLMDIDHIDPLHPHTIGAAEINGQKIRVTFDTGAFTSMLSLRAAEKAGVKPDSPGVIDGGYSGGIGRTQTKSFIGTFSSFKIGDSEEIKNAKLRFAAMTLDNSDMLVGADFFVSHRIFVANKEHRLFMTYNGGPVFNLSKNSNNQADSPPGAASPVGDQTADGGAKPLDAAELARRGSALAARRDFGPALTDLSNAIELEPSEPEYYYQRANAYLGNAQMDLALADFDRVIELKKDFLPAYIPRAEIKLAKKERSAALDDLDTVDHLAPKEADLRLALGEIDERLERYTTAIDQFGIWIQFHADDSRMNQARAGRCYSAAVQNQDLSMALSDCNTALRLSDKSNKAYANLYANRALVRLRQGDYGKAVADCNDALKIAPNNARALYARAVAEARQNKKQDSDTDVQAAKRISPDIADKYAKLGMSP